MALSRVKYDNLEDGDGKEVNELSDSRDDGDDSDDSDYQNDGRESSRTTWWCQNPAVKRNAWAVILAHILLFTGIGCIIAGLILEIIYHAGMYDVFRGFVLFAVGIIVLIPGVYALLHLYLAAKRVGRVRFSSVWFFTR